MNKIFTVTISLWLLSLLSSLFVLQSCVPDDCGPSPSGPISEAEARVYRKVDPQDTENSFGFEPVLNLADLEITYDSLLIQIEFIAQVAMINSYRTSMAFACSPLPVQAELTSLMVTSDSDYDDNHPAGTNLIDVMSFSERELRLSLENPSLSSLEFIETLASYYVHFNSPPSGNRTHNLRFEFRGIEGEVVIEALTPITIRRE